MINIIPMPENITEKKGKLSLDRNKITVSVGKELTAILPMINQVLKSDFTKAEGAAELSFIYDASLKKEHYSLSTDEKGIRVWASGYEGAFYALTTLRQLMGSDIASDKLICPFVEIKNDGPAYSWRGLQLDESRHFFGKETVKKYLDFMSLYKLNRFHWHLTDDNGWRIEIKKYPLLTEIGSKRKGSQLHHWQCKEMDESEHSGFYTQEDIREIISYAKERCIEIVPEIDFPAHSAAAIAAYGNLACREIHSEVFPFFGGVIPASKGITDWNRTLCLGKDEVLEFVYDVIDEVAELFPFKYFHVGGDEAPLGEWKKCAACQQRIKIEGLKDEVALQGWFTNKVNSYLKEKDKIMMGWNEILASRLIDRDIIVQYWTAKRDRNVNNHLKNGGETVLSCHKYFYFDMLHSYCSVKGTYKFKPSTAKVPKCLKGSVIGYEGEAWTEFIREENQLFFMVFNRALALSEAVWSKDKVKDYSSFKNRLSEHKKIMDALSINYGPDFLTMKRNYVKKYRLSKKNGIDPKHFDSEYRLSKILK
ncbi:MAG: beta-N-acetylhexosaminidase [Clostridia bacterium]|nr:beta-N-acetylhexosaminidase [Clostridia bacterium]